MLAAAGLMAVTSAKATATTTTIALAAYGAFRGCGLKQYRAVAGSAAAGVDGTTATMAKQVLK